MNVAVFYPWHILYSEDHGAAIRTRALLAALDKIESVKKVYVLYPGIGEEGPKPEKVVNIELFAFANAIENTNSKNFLTYLYFNHGRRFDDLIEFRQAVRNLEVNLIFSEYHFYSDIIRLFTNEAIPIITTIHDLFSQHRAFGRALCADDEIARIAGNSTLAIFCSKEDQEIVGDRVGAEFLPHPYLERSLVQTLADQCIKPSRLQCLFVGSANPANITATRELRKWSKMAVLKDAVDFHVVGHCGKGFDETDNFFPHQYVTGEQLGKWYGRCDVCIVNLTEGSGSSVKIVEALSTGIQVISSQVGKRGIFGVDSFKNLDTFYTEAEALDLLTRYAADPNLLRKKRLSFEGPLDAFSIDSFTCKIEELLKRFATSQSHVM